MEDNKETVKDRTVATIRRNRVKIACVAAGAVTGAAGVVLFKNASAIKWAREVREVLDAAGEYVMDVDDIHVVMTRVTEN